MRFNVSFFREIKLSVMFCIVVCLVVLVFSPSAAVAQGEEEVKLMPTESKDKPLSVEENWYGWKILISGGSSLAVPFLTYGIGISADSTWGSVAIIPASFLGIIGYLSGGPIIHWAHGATGKGFASLGINVAGAGLGLLVGAMIGKDGDLDEFITGGIIGMSVGAVGAILVDGLWLAYEPVYAPEGTSFNIGLSVGLNGLSVVGQF
jgi:hypothetical protein